MWHCAYRPGCLSMLDWSEQLWETLAAIPIHNVQLLQVKKQFKCGYCLLYWSCTRPVILSSLEEEILSWMVVVTNKTMTCDSSSRVTSAQSHWQDNIEQWVIQASLIFNHVYNLLNLNHLFKWPILNYSSVIHKSKCTWNQISVKSTLTYGKNS